MPLTKEQKIRIYLTAGSLIIGFGCGTLIEQYSYSRQMADQIQQRVFGVQDRPTQIISDDWKENTTQRLEDIRNKLAHFSEILLKIGKSKEQVIPLERPGTSHEGNVSSENIEKHDTHRENFESRWQEFNRNFEKK